MCKGAKSAVIAEIDYDESNFIFVCSLSLLKTRTFF